MGIKGAYSRKIFDTDLSVAAATNIKWLLPGVESHVAITLSPSLGADLQACQSQYIREGRKW